MEYNLFDKNVLITGAASGIGEFIVRHLAKEGAKNIYVLDVDEEAGNKLQEDLNTKLQKRVVKFMKCDVSQEDQLFRVFEEALKDFRHGNHCANWVVNANNAGLADESSPAKIRKLVEVNYLAVVNLTLKALESMRKDHGGRGGTVLNVSSIASLSQLCPALFIYFGTKSAVMQFSNCIGKPEFYSRTGVRVITICYGRTDTSIQAKALSFDEQINQDKGTMVQEYLPIQSAEFAAHGAIEALKSGESGSTWLSSGKKPVEDITESVTKAYGIMAQTFT